MVITFDLHDGNLDIQVPCKYMYTLRNTDVR